MIFASAEPAHYLLNTVSIGGQDARVISGMLLLVVQTVAAAGVGVRLFPVLRNSLIERAERVTPTLRAPA